MLMIELTRARPWSFDSPPSSFTNDRSIFKKSIGKLRRYERDEYPVPKSLHSNPKMQSSPVYVETDKASRCLSQDPCYHQQSHHGSKGKMSRQSESRQDDECDSGDRARDDDHRKKL